MGTEEFLLLSYCQVFSRGIFAGFGFLNPFGFLGGLAVGLFPHSAKGANCSGGGLPADVALAEFKVLLGPFHYGTDAVQKH